MAPDCYDLPTRIIDSPESLAEALPDWFAANLLAVDIECSLTGFHNCVMALLQVATHDKAWLVDPLAIPGLMRPALLAMAEVPWIAHDFSGDGIVFKRLYDVVPDSVLDTMLLARTLGYPQPGLKTMARIKLGIEIPKEEQDSNWMHRPLRAAQLDYAARDATLLLPLLRALAAEAEIRRDDPEAGPRLRGLPREMQRMLGRVRNYQAPAFNPVLEKVRHLGLGEAALEKARKLTDLRCRWGNQGDVAAVMELGNRWIIARLVHPPQSKEALERCIPNPRFRRARLDAIWAVLGEN